MLRERGAYNGESNNATCGIGMDDRRRWLASRHKAVTPSLPAQEIARESSGLQKRAAIARPVRYDRGQGA
jgi:hypothetical protein